MNHLKLPNASTLVDLFWRKIESEYSIDIDDFVYDIISHFDFQYLEDENDEKDKMREEVLQLLHFTGYNEESELDQRKSDELGRQFAFEDLLLVADDSLLRV